MEINRAQLLDIARQARDDLEQRRFSETELVELWQAYYPDDADAAAGIVMGALALFPRLSCGLGSGILRSRVGSGEIVDVAYRVGGRSLGHTVLRLINGDIMDITADQFGGPSVYVGPAVDPWRF